MKVKQFENINKKGNIILVAFLNMAFEGLDKINVQLLIDGHYRITIVYDGDFSNSIFIQAGGGAFCYAQ